MTTKKIGLVFWKIGDNSFGSTISYLQFAEQFGEVVPLMPEHTLRTDLDLIILPGGADVDPLSYGEVPGYFTGKADLFKEHFDKVYLPQYIAAGVPLFGVCRGHQALATHFNGKLIQHMNHETNDVSKDPFSVMHYMSLTSDFTTRSNFTDYSELPVNSRHHQVVDEESLPAELKVLGYHRSFNTKTAEGKSDNSVEMIAHTELPIVGIQCHPEDIFNVYTNEFINNIVNHLITNRTSILS